jgi:hypothetical protein
MRSTILTDIDGHTAEPSGTPASVGRPESFYIRCDVWHRVPIERRAIKKIGNDPLIGQRGPMESKMAKADQLATLMAFLLVGYFALTVAGAFAFTFVW